MFMRLISNYSSKIQKNYTTLKLGKFRKYILIQKSIIICLEMHENQNGDLPFLRLDYTVTYYLSNIIQNPIYLNFLS